VAIDVAIALAVSWKPFVKSKESGIRFAAGYTLVFKSITSGTPCRP
jgi:hypothetical protein